ncbi:DNA-processing protein DprA [Dawidia soli]|uniref:DNA-processing protein DprA n=1 Tax=Dawidia soli TaxID=2782352 RepID=A0AAP2D474_9BACT|nr:DNA-processing protein DprA [Dawidia soli]MBT1684993.1 DNA-processing protein DprA [Dawidia soli]
MQLSLGSSTDRIPPERDLMREMAAYEALWNTPDASMRKLAALFARHPGQPPSALVAEHDIAQSRQQLQALLEGTVPPGILLHGTPEYPARLRDAEHPVELLYYRGDLSLLQTRLVTVVGTRHPTAEGLARTTRLVGLLVGDGVTIVSGLAVGIDAVAHRAALVNNGRTVGVIGTPLNHTYPPAHADLQETIARRHLLISPVPYRRYARQGYQQNSKFFPERNRVSAALSEATIIVEAGDTSGTLGLAHAALYQKRKVFILDSSLSDAGLRWPRRLEARGGIRVTTYDDIRRALQL